jgi:hypothetical protein
MRTLWSILACAAVNPLTQGQCVWVPGDVVWGLNGNVYAMANMPNGDLIVGGAFTSDGAGHAVLHVARFDGSTWEPVGEGLNGTVRALLVLPSGELIAGGSFSVSSGTGAQMLSGSGIARWDGESWTPVGRGVFTSGAGAGGVLALTAMPNGDLVAGGTFTHFVAPPCELPPCANPIAVNHIARYNGTEWLPLGTGTTGNFSPVPGGGNVYALATLGNGDLVAGGDFFAAGGAPAAGVARWNGTSWSSMLGGTSAPAHAITRVGTGDLVVGGQFNMSGNVITNHVARWSPQWSVWTALRTGVNGSVLAFTTMPNGDLIAGGAIVSADGVPVANMARWNFSRWEAFCDVGNGSVYAMTLRPNGEFFVGGSFRSSGGSAVDRIARWVCRCPADLDNDGDFSNGMSRDNAVTIEDLLAFLVGFEAGDVLIDLDDDGDGAVGTPDAAVDVNDLLFFLSRFEAGC